MFAVMYRLETVIRTDEDVEDVYLVFKHIDTSLKKFLATPFPFDIKKLGKVSEFLLTIVCKLVL
jgi:hypothetical protein